MSRSTAASTKATTKTTETDPRIEVLRGEFIRVHTLRADIEKPADKASATRSLQRLWDALVTLDGSAAVTDLPPIKAPKSAALISADASAILASLK